MLNLETSRLFLHAKLVPYFRFIPRAVLEQVLLFLILSSRWSRLGVLCDLVSLLRKVQVLLSEPACLNLAG